MTSTTPLTDLAEVIARIERILAEVLATTAEPGGPGGWHHLRDRALGDLTVGLPDVDCAVCIAAAPAIAVTSDPAAAAEARGRLLRWLTGTRDQLRLGRAVAESLAHRTARRATTEA